jgi:hypothetical protein
VPIALPAQDVVLAAGAAKEIVWPVSVPAEAFSIAWEAAVEETGAARDAGRDRLKMTQLVAAAVPCGCCRRRWPSSRAGSACRGGAGRRLADAGGGRRGASSGGAAAPDRGTPGLRRFFATYPFICLEQKTSKTIGLKDAQMWAAVANALPTTSTATALPATSRLAPTSRRTAATASRAYVLAATHEAGFELPAQAADGDARRPDGVRRRAASSAVLVAPRRPRRAQDGRRSRRCRATAGPSRGSSARSTWCRTPGPRRP